MAAAQRASEGIDLDKLSMALNEIEASRDADRIVNALRTGGRNDAWIEQKLHEALRRRPLSQQSITRITKLQQDEDNAFCEGLELICRTMLSVTSEMA